MYELQTGRLVFQEPDASSVAWNTCFEDMLAYSGNGHVSIIVADFAPHRQRLQGYVVGFSGSNIFYLNVLAVSSLEVPHSEPMMHQWRGDQWPSAATMAPRRCRPLMRSQQVVPTNTVLPRLKRHAGQGCYVSQFCQQ